MTADRDWLFPLAATVAKLPDDPAVMRFHYPAHSSRTATVAISRRATRSSSKPARTTGSRHSLSIFAPGLSSGVRPAASRTDAILQSSPHLSSPFQGSVKAPFPRPGHIIRPPWAQPGSRPRGPRACEAGCLDAGRAQGDPRTAGRKTPIRKNTASFLSPARLLLSLTNRRPFWFR